MTGSSELVDPAESIGVATRERGLESGGRSSVNSRLRGKCCRLGRSGEESLVVDRLSRLDRFRMTLTIPLVSEMVLASLALLPRRRNLSPNRPITASVARRPRSISLAHDQLLELEVVLVPPSVTASSSTGGAPTLGSKVAPRKTSPSSVVNPCLDGPSVEGPATGSSACLRRRRSLSGVRISAYCG